MTTPDGAEPRDDVRDQTPGGHIPPYDPTGSGLRWALRERWHDLRWWHRHRRGQRLQDAVGVLGDVGHEVLSVVGALLTHVLDRGRDPHSGEREARGG